MKCLIVYFSQTGNTEKVAKAIQAGIKEAGVHCDITGIKDANPKRLYDYDLIGLGAPVFGAVPSNVSFFIKNMRFVGGKHAFAFATHGTFPDLFFPEIFVKLKKRGLVVIGSRSWYADCSLLHMPTPYPTAGHPDEIDLKDAESFGKEMVDHSQRISSGEASLIPPAPPMAEPPVLKGQDGKESQRPPEYRKMAKFIKEECLYPECRLCMENCPVDGIDLSVEPPVFATPCIDCEFCAKICPTSAINAEAFINFMSNAARTMMPMFLPKLEKAEAEGRFRRLIKVEDIDLNKFNFKMLKNHPYWIIGKGWNLE